MKPKSKNGQQVTIGRSRVTLPGAADLTPEQVRRARAKHVVAHNDAVRTTMAEKDAEIAKLKREKDDDGVEWVCLTRAAIAGFDKQKTGQLVDEGIKGARAARRAGVPFKLYDLIDAFVAEHQTLTPAKPNADGSTTEPTRLAKPGGPKTFAEIVKEREAYTKRLRELGLDAPFLPVGRG